MADCRTCGTRITATGGKWLHLDTSAVIAGHRPEPPLVHKWHKRDQNRYRDRHGPRWSRPDAKIQLPPDFYDRD